MTVAEPDRIAVAEHDVVGAGAAIDGLVEVVAHRVVVREALEVRSVALLDVVETQRRGAFTGRRPRSARYSVLKVRYRAVAAALAICAGTHRDFDPRKQLLRCNPKDLPRSRLSALQFNCCHIW